MNNSNPRQLPLLAVAMLALIATSGCQRDAPAPATAAGPAGSAATADPLPSWHDGGSKKAILDFVKKVTLPDGLVSFNRVRFISDALDGFAHRAVQHLRVHVEHLTCDVTYSYIL